MRSLITGIVVGVAIGLIFTADAAAQKDNQQQQPETYEQCVRRVNKEAAEMKTLCEQYNQDKSVCTVSADNVLRNIKQQCGYPPSTNQFNQ